MRFLALSAILWAKCWSCNWFFYLTVHWQWTRHHKFRRHQVDNFLRASAMKMSNSSFLLKFVSKSDCLPACSLFPLPPLTLQDFRMHLTATGKLGRSLTTITKMDRMMLFWLTNSWYKQATEQSPLTSARYCMRVHTDLYRNTRVIRSRRRCKEHVVVSLFILINWMPELHLTAWPQWLLQSGLCCKVFTISTGNACPWLLLFGVRSGILLCQTRSVSTEFFVRSALLHPKVDGVWCHARQSQH